MTTHEFARALMLMSRTLKASPDIELKDWSMPSIAGPESTGRSGRSKADTGLALGVLVGMSKYSKGEWAALIKDWGLNVDIKRSDSVRDLLGRLLNYLHENPGTAKRITSESKKKSTKASPELSKILSILLGESDEDAQSKTGKASEGG